MGILMVVAMVFMAPEASTSCLDVVQLAARLEALRATKWDTITRSDIGRVWSDALRPMGHSANPSEPTVFSNLTTTAKDFSPCLQTLVFELSGGSEPRQERLAEVVLGLSVPDEPSAREALRLLIRATGPPANASPHAVHVIDGPVTPAVVSEGYRWNGLETGHSETVFGTVRRQDHDWLVNLRWRRQHRK
jgi:hypothetical protein